MQLRVQTAFDNHFIDLGTHCIGNIIFYAMMFSFINCNNVQNIKLLFYINSKI